MVLELHPLENITCMEVNSVCQKCSFITSPYRDTFPAGERRMHVCPCVCVNVEVAVCGFKHTLKT